MKERLVQLLDLEQLSPSKFADIIGVQRSSVSHVISGRNNPSFDFIQKTLNAFPGLNADWLILGKGTMYEQMGRLGTGNLFDDRPSPEPAESIAQDDLRQRQLAQDSPGEGMKRGEPNASEGSEPDTGHVSDDSPYGSKGTQREALAGAAFATESQHDKGHVATTERRISRVILLYDDDTFVSFDPS